MSPWQGCRRCRTLLPLRGDHTQQKPHEVSQKEIHLQTNEDLWSWWNTAIKRWKTESSERAATVSFGREIHCSTSECLKVALCCVIPAFDFLGFRSQLSTQYLWAFCLVFSGKGMTNDVHLISFHISLVIELQSFPFQISNTNGNNHTWNTWSVLV